VKFFDMWILAPDFRKLVSKHWQAKMQGTPMYKLVSMQKALKNRLEAPNISQFGEIHAKTISPQRQLHNIQHAISLDSLTLSCMLLKKWPLLTTISC